MEKSSTTRLGYSLCALLTVVFLLSGCAFLGGRSEHAEQARELFSDALANIEAGELDQALGNLSRLRREFADTPQGRQAVLEKAYVSYRLGRFAEAIELLEKYAEGRPDAASEDIAYAMFLRASAAYSRWQEQTAPLDTSVARQAFTFYRQFVQRFPESERVEEALRQMSRIRSDLAAEELRRARASMAEGELVEAAERAAWVAEQYPGQQEAGDALALQADALERLGRPRQAKATRRMLEIKHPQHPAVE